MIKKYLDQYDDGNPQGADDSGLNAREINKIATLVGKVLIKFNSLESGLEYMIAESINRRSTQPGYSVVSEMNIFTKKVSLFKALYGQLVEYSDKAGLKPLFKKTVTQLWKVKDFRNEIVHANWEDATKDFTVRLKIGSDEKGPYAQIDKFSPALLKKRIDDLENAGNLLAEFGEKIDE